MDVHETSDDFPEMPMACTEVQSLPREPETVPMPFTHIAYQGHFYTTDDSGFFLHYPDGKDLARAVAGGGKGVLLMSCTRSLASDEIGFQTVRELSPEEYNLFEHIDDRVVKMDMTCSRA